MSDISYNFMFHTFSQQSHITRFKRINAKPALTVGPLSLVIISWFFI